MICKSCGKMCANGIRFCPYCGTENTSGKLKIRMGGSGIAPQRKPVSSAPVQRPQTEYPAPMQQKPAKRKTWPWIALLCFLLLLAALLLWLLLRNGSGEEEPAQQAEDYSDSALYGSWYSYSGGYRSPESGEIIGVDVRELHLESSKEAKFLVYTTNSDVYAEYSGTWDATMRSENTAELSLRLVGGAHAMDSGDDLSVPLNATFTVRVTLDRLTVTDTDDTSAAFAGETFVRDLSLEDWVQQELQALTENDICRLYKRFFYENFSDADLVCLADVTRDGVAELLVVHDEDEMQTRIYGYVYTIDKTGAVKLIYTKTGSAFNIGGFFYWYLRLTSEGYALAEESGYWSTGLGDLTYHEYYLSEIGAVCDIYSIRVNSLELETMEENAIAFDAYQQSKNERLKNVYVLYDVFGCAEALGDFMASPSEVFP